MALLYLERLSIIPYSNSQSSPLVLHFSLIRISPMGKVEYAGVAEV